MKTASQIVTRAVQIAKAPLGMAPQAGQILNEVLDELVKTYDLEVAVYTTTVNLTGTGPNNGTGPYSLPANYLRACSRDLTYMISGVPYRLIQITKAQFDALVNTTGIANYPTNFMTDVSQSPPQLFVYPPPLTLIPLQIRYYGTFADITTPESSSTVPWFPFDTYLIRRVAGELMAITGDPRESTYLGDGPQGCVGILRRWLNLQGDREDIPSQVTLDARYFGPGGAAFPPSKVTGGV